MEYPDPNELIDFGSPLLIASEPLVPPPVSQNSLLKQPFGMCLSPNNPFDQLVELTNMSICSKDDPFELVCERAFNNTHTKKAHKRISSKKPSLSGTECSVESARTSPINIFEEMKGLDNFSQQCIDSYEQDSTLKYPKLSSRGKEGSVATVKTVSAKSCNSERSLDTKKENVTTGKLLDLPSPESNSDFSEPSDSKCEYYEDGDVSNQSKTEEAMNKIEACELEKSFYADKGSSSYLQHSEVANSATDRMKSVVAKRVERCIQKALNDSKLRFRSGSVSDLRNSESRSNDFKHRRSLSSSALQNSLKTPAEELKNIRNFGSGCKHSLHESFSSYGCLNRAFWNNASSAESSIPMSLVGVLTDIEELESKVTWKSAAKCKIIDSLIGKYASGFKGSRDTIDSCGKENHSMLFKKEANETCDRSFQADENLDDVMLDRLSETAFSKYESNSCYLLDSIIEPWLDDEPRPEPTYLGPLNVADVDKGTSIRGCSGLPSSLIKMVPAEGSFSLDNSSLPLPMLHSTPIVRRELKTAALSMFTEKSSPILPSVPLPVQAGSVGMNVKFKPVRNVQEQELKRGPMKAVVPLTEMTKSPNEELMTQKKCSVETGRQDKEAQHVDSCLEKPDKYRKTHSALSVSNTTSLLQNRTKKTPVSSPAERKGVHITQPLVPKTAVSQKIKINFTNSFHRANAQSQKLLGKVLGRERSRSVDVKEIAVQKINTKVVQKSISASSIQPAQYLSRKRSDINESNLTKKTPPSKFITSSSKNKNSFGCLKNSKGISQINQLTSKVRRATPVQGKENVIPK